MSLSNFSIFIVKFRIRMVELVRINVSFVPKIKKIFSTLTPSSGQTISLIGLSNISLESVLHKLSFGIKISRLPVDPKPYGKKTDFFHNWEFSTSISEDYPLWSLNHLNSRSHYPSICIHSAFQKISSEIRVVFKWRSDVLLILGPLMKI